MKRRFYFDVIKKHFKESKKMIFFMGPRQVGKTTLVKDFGKEYKNFKYLNWDNQDHRYIILQGPKAVAAFCDIDILKKNREIIIVFDEIQKYENWKGFLKGFFDTYGNFFKIIVTGSARLDIFQRGADSLMGRYFPYFVHPISVGEILRQKVREKEIASPKKIAKDKFETLWNFGGFPEPFFGNNIKLYNKWKSLRLKQFVQEDIRDLTNIEKLDKMEILLTLIRSQVGQLVSYTSLAKKLRISDNSIRKWIKIIENLYFCFSIKPWFKNIKKSLLKEPKYYLWDWAMCLEDSFKLENLVASHLLKAAHFWTNFGFGDFGLYFLRDKNKREVDFLVVKDGIPWMMVEVKSSLNKSISSSFFYFYEILKPKYAFQVVLNMDFIKKDCFLEKRPVIVPLFTFLSQLI